MHRKFRLLVRDAVVAGAAGHRASHASGGRAHFSDAAVSAALHDAQETRREVLLEAAAVAARLESLVTAEVTRLKGSDLSEVTSAAALAALSPERELMTALLLQHYRLQWETDELSSDLAFLGACRTMLAREGGGEELLSLQETAALEVLRDGMRSVCIHSRLFPTYVIPECSDCDCIDACQLSIAR